jgi:hypothetical protein
LEFFEKNTCGTADFLAGRRGGTNQFTIFNFRYPFSRAQVYDLFLRQAVLRLRSNRLKITVSQSLDLGIMPVILSEAKDLGGECELVPARENYSAGRILRFTWFRSE